jgi:hypothetical protein
MKKTYSIKYPAGTAPTEFALWEKGELRRVYVQKPGVRNSAAFVYHLDENYQVVRRQDMNVRHIGGWKVALPQIEEHLADFLQEVRATKHLQEVRATKQ